MIPAECSDLLKNELFVEIMDNIDDIVMIIDRDTNIVYVNKSYERTFKWKREKIIGKKLQDIEGNTTAIRAMEKGETLVHTVEYLKSANIDSVGVSFPLRVNGEIVGGVSVFNDMSKYVSLVSKLQKTKEMNKYLEDCLGDPMLQKWSKEFITVNPHMKKVLELAMRVAQAVRGKRLWRR